jgi:putative hydrolase of the HAD superfamily
VLRVLMLDIDGVIVRAKNDCHWSINLENDLGIGPAVLQRYFFEPYWEQIVTGRANLDECLEDALRTIAPSITAEQLMAYWFQNDAELDQRVLRDLALIRSPTLPVYFASKQEHKRVHHLMEVVGLRSHVDGWFYSAALGCKKPDRAFFESIQAQINMPPSNFLLVDESGDNVAAANSVGWSAEHWTPTQDIGRSRRASLLLTDRGALAGHAER